MAATPRAQAADNAHDDDEVEITREVTLEERNAAGFANAIDVDALFMDGEVEEFVPAAQEKGVVPPVLRHSSSEQPRPPQPQLPAWTPHQEGPAQPVCARWCCRRGSRHDPGAMSTMI